MDWLIDFIVGVSPIFAAYYLVALGHGLMEKSGVLNLAIDGVFVLSVAVAFAVGIYYGSSYISILVPMIIASLFGLMLAFITTKLPISHGAAGLSTMFLGYGLASLVGIPARQAQRGAATFNIEISVHSPAWIMLYIISILIGIGVLLLVEKTKLGAAIRASGEDPAAAEALGVNVLITRLIASGLGYLLIGLGAALFEVAYSPVWSEGQGMGYGWIAFAISLSAGRHPLLIIVSAFVFAALEKYRFAIAAAYGLPTDFAKMLPFIAAISAMVLFMATPLRKKLAPPKSLGKIYFREERTV